MKIIIPKELVDGLKIYSEVFEIYIDITQEQYEELKQDILEYESFKQNRYNSPNITRKTYYFIKKVCENYEIELKCKQRNEKIDKLLNE